MRMIRAAGILDGGKTLVHDGAKVWISYDKPNEVNIDKQINLILNRDSGIMEQEVFGDGVFDFRYGPVTGGVLESGVYHLYTYGERILGVNIDWSHKHRGIEKHMVGLSVEEALRFVEQICGNFAFSHSLAFSRAVESALAVEALPQLRKLRIIALELERIYNHVYVISQLASAAAQKVMTSHLQAIYEDLLRLNDIFFGSRFLKGFNGIISIKKSFDIDALLLLSHRVNDLSNQFEYFYKRALDSENFMDRLHDTGKLDSEAAMRIGVTGPTLRATGIREDFRLHDPDYKGLRCATSQMGDSLARMEVRAEEVFESVQIISDISGELKQSTYSEIDQAKNGMVKLNHTGAGTGYCESPGGLLAYHVEIEDGKISSVYASTPSIFGFNAVAESLVGNIFTDFPFVIESFGVYFADAAR